MFISISTSALLSLQWKAILECFGDTITSLLLLLRSLRGVLWKKDSNVMPHSVHCSFCCYVHCPWFFKKNLFIINYVLYSMLWSKRSKILFQRYVHDTMIMKNIRFTVGFVKNTLINCYYVDYAAIMTKKYIFSFQHYYIHYTVWWEKSTFSPVANCYYVHYVAIMSTTFTTPWSWQKYMLSFSSVCTTSRSYTKNILFSFQYYAL